MHRRGDFHFVGEQIFGDGVEAIGPPSSSAAELDLNLRFPGVDLISPDSWTLTDLVRLSSAAAASGGEPFPAAMLGMLRLVRDRSKWKCGKTVRDMCV